MMSFVSAPHLGFWHSLGTASVIYSQNKDHPNKRVAFAIQIEPYFFAPLIFAHLALAAALILALAAALILNFFFAGLVATTAFTAGLAFAALILAHLALAAAETAARPAALWRDFTFSGQLMC